MRHTIICIGWIAVAFTAIYLRMNNLGDNPVHFDEATGASILEQALSGENPGFNPKHFHGPWLRESTILIARLRGENDWNSLSVETLRLGPALAGCLLCLTPLLWISAIRPMSALATGALLATSPLAVYYSRIYVHESWLALFGMLSCATIYRFLKNPNQSISVFAGISIGLMFATKETFVVYILAWAIAGSLFLFFHTTQEVRPQFRDYLKPFISMCFWCVLISAFFYTDYFRNPTAYIEAFRTFFIYETTAGHTKPFTYYFHLLLWPKQAFGLIWTEGLVAILACITIPLSLSNKHQVGLIRFIAVAVVVQFLIYSFINYKTPWLMLLTWAHVCLWAGMLFQTWSHFTRIKQTLLSILFISSLGWQAQQSFEVTGNISNDARNPYAYAPSSRDLTNLPQWLENLSATANIQPAAVVGSSFWPLPWYLRTIENLTYWSDIQPDFNKYAVVFVMPEHAAKADKLLLKSHQRLPRGLRENVAIMMYLRDDIWDKWTKKEIL